MTKTQQRKDRNKEQISDIKLYTLTELEEILGVTHRTLLTMVKENRLKAVKVCGKWRVKESTLRELLGA